MAHAVILYARIAAQPASGLALGLTRVEEEQR